MIRIIFGNCRWMALASMVGCAVHLQTPQPDLLDRSPVRPAPQLSHLAAVVRLSHESIGRMVEQRMPERQAGTESLGVLQGSWEIRREGHVAVRGDERGRLCFVLPFAGKGALQAFGQRMDKELRAHVHACARPELDAGATLHLREPDVRVLIERTAAGGPIQLLLDAITTKLQAVTGQAALERLREFTVPTWDALAPLQALLATPVPLPQQGCLKLRPQSLRLTQPVIDPTALRMGATVAALPTAEQPCAAEPRGRPPGRMPVAVVADLESPKTFLLLPVAVALDTLTDQVKQAVEKVGVIKTDQGWVKVTAVRLSTAKGSLLVHATIAGEVNDRILFVPIQRAVQGEVLLWGVPTVGTDGIHLTELELDVRSDDRLVELAASLKNSQLKAIIAEKLMIRRDFVEQQAKKALDEFGKGVMVGGEKMPMAITIEQLQVETVAAVGQRLEVTVRYVGQVTVGDTAAK